MYVTKLYIYIYTWDKLATSTGQPDFGTINSSEPGIDPGLSDTGVYCRSNEPLEATEKPGGKL